MYRAISLLLALTISAPPAMARETVVSVEGEKLAGRGLVRETTLAQDARGGAYVLIDGGQKDPSKPLPAFVEIPFAGEAGSYSLTARVYARGSGADSFWFVLDGAAPRSVSPREKGRWVEVGVDFAIYVAGEHVVKIAAREPTRLDYVEIVKRKITHQSPLQPRLVFPEPDGRRPLYIDPPTLRWPQFGEGPYTVQLSPTADFAKPKTFNGVSNLFLRPFQPIGAGEWHFRVKAADGKTWLGPIHFTLPETARPWPIEPWDKQLANIPKQHPRLMLRPEDVPRYRQLVQGELKGLREKWERESRGALGQKLDPIDDQQGAVANQREGVMRRVSSKYASNKYCRPIFQLCLLYQLTGERKWADEALRRARIIMNWNPDGYTAHNVSDFANANIVRSLGFVYDYLNDLLSAAEKTRIRQVLVERIRPPMSNYMRGMELAPYGAHAWQHIIQDLTAGALAIHGEGDGAAPETTEWIEWSLKMHVAFYPWYGEGDGSSAEGANYHKGTNMLTSLAAARLLEAATGTDLTQNPWYRNNFWYIMYAHPPGAPLSGFADRKGYPLPHSSEKLAAQLEAARYGNGFARAYSDGNFDGSFSNDATSLLLFWHGDKAPPAKPLAELPAARMFPTGGLVYCHSDFARPENNLFFEFRSSFFGSYNHAHADQNSFNLFAYGDPLIVDSGYYTSYGDEHHYGWTVRTRAHNTILIGDTEQGHRSLDAFGRITHFEDKGIYNYVYFIGSCPAAYRDVAVERFDRHVLWLKPNVYIIVDNIETAEPQTIQWLLHADNKMELDPKTQTARLKTKKAEARVTWLTPQELTLRQTDQFSNPPEAWRSDNKDQEYPNQWHLTAATKQPARRHIVITVIQPCRAGDYDKLTPPTLAASDRERSNVRVRAGGIERAAAFDGATGRLLSVK